MPPQNDPVRIALTGGVSCEVAIVREPDGREIVVKQPLARLKVAADWRADPARFQTEVDALRTLRALLGVHVAPDVLWVDPPNQRFAMERIDPHLRNWRDEIDRGHIDLATARRVGELLGLMHTRAATRADIHARFASHEYFEQLRIEPFFERVATRNPAIAASVGTAIEALRASGRTLVHGDFSPKNLLVAGSEVVILDCEVAHWGDPRFDVGFCLMHLLLDGIHLPAHRAALREAATTFLDAYATSGLPGVLDVMLVRITGCLILARLEGDSPINYLAELDAAEVKRIAVHLIVNPGHDPAAMVRVVLDST
jgi:tRNA A-37 threonylcarbamoyl transferase component Bud32